MNNRLMFGVFEIGPDEANYPQRFAMFAHVLKALQYGLCEAHQYQFHRHALSTRLRGSHAQKRPANITNRKKSAINRS